MELHPELAAYVARVEQEAELNVREERLAQAEESLTQAYASFRLGSAQIAESLAEVLWEADEEDRALALLNISSVLYKELDDPRSFSRVKSFIGDILDGLGRLPESVSAYLEAEAWPKAGRQLRALGRTVEAFEVLSKVREQYAKAKKTVLLAEVDDQIGELMLEERRPTEAIPWFERALAGFEAAGNISMAAEERKSLARARKLQEKLALP